MYWTLPHKSPKELGQTIVGILVAVAIFSILAQAIFTVVGASFNLVSFNRARITARHLAEEKLELIRNLPYDNVGTTGGIPNGPLPQEENTEENGLSYTVKTTIIYIDDPFDDTAPTDLLPTDYKRVRVEISWQGVTSSKKSPVVLLTDIVPKGIETTEGGGTLSIIVFDANGNPLSQADVTISAPSVSPPVSLTLKSGSNGRVLLPGAPACISCYDVSVSKDGYSSERTYSTSEVANPNKPTQTVIEGQLTEIGFAIDKTATLNITSKVKSGETFSTLPNVSFEIRGDKTIGTDSSSQPIYKYDQTLTTNSSGTLIISDIEWDNYKITRDPSSSYDISGFNPLTPIQIDPDTAANLDIAFSPHTTNSLLVTFVDDSSIPIASVSAVLDGTEAKLSGVSENPDYGQVFYSNLSSQLYPITATASGYLDYSRDIQVNGQTQEKIILNQ